MHADEHKQQGLVRNLKLSIPATIYRRRHFEPNICASLHTSTKSVPHWHFRSATSHSSRTKLLKQLKVWAKKKFSGYWPEIMRQIFFHALDRTSYYIDGVEWPSKVLNIWFASFSLAECSFACSLSANGTAFLCSRSSSRRIHSEWLDAFRWNEKVKINLNRAYFHLN